MEIISSENLNEIRKHAEKLKKENKSAIVQGRDIEFNRLILEMKNIDSLILALKQNKDKLKQRNSGLNEVLCKLAKAKKISLLFDFSEILNSEGKERAELLSRMIQNIKLTRKYANSVQLINKSGRSDYDLRCFLQTLGMPNDMAKKAVV